MTNEAIILAGGLGTRLQSVLSEVPKSMAPICNRPFLEYQFDWLQKNGIIRVILSVGFRHEVILNHFGNHWKGIDIDYAIENEPLGTGGGILLAAKICNGSHAFVLNGDTMFDCELLQMDQMLNESHTDMVMALRKVNDASRYGTVIMDNQNMVLGFTEKTNNVTPGTINGGVYLLSLNRFISEAPSNKFSFEKDFMEKKCDLWNIKGMVSEGFFLDIGIPSDYSKAQDEFKRFNHII